MAYIKRDDGWHIARKLCAESEFFFTRHTRAQRKRSSRVPKVYPTFPPVLDHKYHGHRYRLAELSDLDNIVLFVDRLLSGRDFFCPRGQHISYFKYKTIVICLQSDKLIGWAVRQKAGSLIHLLVDPDCRGHGIGSHLLEILEPLVIRSKSDQSTGDPIKFYEKHGYTKTSDERVGRNKNIDLLSKPTPLEEQSEKTTIQS